MKILLAPLNWGLGHAARCIPLVYRLRANGDEVVLGGDGASLALLQQHFPQLPTIALPALNLHYSAKGSQTWAMAMQLPTLIGHAMRDHARLRTLLRTEQFDQVISDNRFGLFSSQCPCTYLTHQLMVKMPHGLRWAEPIVHWLHGRIIAQYQECLIPDLADNGGLSGDLAHKYSLPANARFIGILSRFESPTEMPPTGCKKYDVVAVLSGLEPQRSLLEKQLTERYLGAKEHVLVVQGLPTNQQGYAKGNIRFVPSLPDAEMAAQLCATNKIIARSGYSSIMDFYVLGVLHKAELIPTPGQPEQEYLAQWLLHRHFTA